MADRDADQEQMTLIRRELTPALWGMLINSGHLPAAMTLQLLDAEIRAGRLALLAGEVAGRQELAMIVRTEDLIGGGQELCVVAVGAARKRVIAGYIRPVMTALEKEIAGLGYSSILLRTDERAMAKRVCRLGYEYVESTFRKKLA